MPSSVTMARHGAVAVLTIDNPPVNALSADVAAALSSEAVSACAETGVDAVIIIGSGKTFVAGADIREFSEIVAGARPPIALNEAFNAIESCSKPVIAAIHGAALGGGLELAMACHYRIARPDAKLGQPEVNLGLIPGAGGTQRLPRLCGIPQALDLCITGKTITAAEGEQIGIIDRLAEQDLLEASLNYANELISNQQVPRRTRDIQVSQTSPQAVEDARQLARQRYKGQTAPAAAVDAVASTGRLSFEDGLAFEKKLFEQCLHGPQSKALIHVFFAERECTKLGGLTAGAKPTPVESAGIVGAGTMGCGIAVCFANAGIPVLITDARPDSLKSATSTIRALYASSVKKGKMTPEAVEERMALIRTVDEIAHFSASDIVIEAVFEHLETKIEVFKALDAVAKPGAILATNTSTLDVDTIAAATSRPGSVCGFHFFAPANIMKLLELVRGKETSPQTLATAMELGRKLRKTAVLAGNCPGFIGNRMFAPYREAAIRCVEQGASPSAVDKALTDWGMAMGPIRVGDLSGIDILREVRIAANLEETVEDRLFAAGRLGQKTGSGWYSYPDGKTAQPDPSVDAMIRDYAVERDIPQRVFSQDEIVARCLEALRAEGQKILDEEMALRSSDIDIVYVHGYGFPAWRGGPMFWGSQRQGASG